MADQDFHNWNTVHKTPVGSSQVVAQYRIHSFHGRAYSFTVSGLDSTRPGFMRIQLEMAEDGTVRCANAAEIQAAVDSAINSAVLDMAQNIKANGLPPVWKPQTPNPAVPRAPEASKVDRPKRTLNLTAEQREARKAKQDANRAAKRENDKNTRTAMKGKSGGGGNKKGGKG